MSLTVEGVWSDTLGSAWEDSRWFIDIEYEGDGAWNKPSNATLIHWDKDDEDKVVRSYFTPQMLAEAYSKLEDMKYTHCGGHALYDQDYCTSDAVLQHMVYGTWIYG